MFVCSTRSDDDPRQPDVWSLRSDPASHGPRVSACNIVFSAHVTQFRVPTVMEKHGTNHVRESQGKWAKKIVMEIENILKKSWNFSTAYHESRAKSSDNSVSIGLH